MTEQVVPPPRAPLAPLAPLLASPPCKPPCKPENLKKLGEFCESGGSKVDHIRKPRGPDKDGNIGFKHRVNSNETSTPPYDKDTGIDKKEEPSQNPLESPNDKEKKENVASQLSDDQESTGKKPPVPVHDDPQMCEKAAGGAEEVVAPSACGENAPLSPIHPSFHPEKLYNKNWEKVLTQFALEYKNGKNTFFIFKFSLLNITQKGYAITLGNNERNFGNELRIFGPPKRILVRPILYQDIWVWGVYPIFKRPVKIPRYYLTPTLRKSKTLFQVGYVNVSMAKILYSGRIKNNNLYAVVFGFFSADWKRVETAYYIEEEERPDLMPGTWGTLNCKVIKNRGGYTNFWNFVSFERKIRVLEHQRPVRHTITSIYQVKCRIVSKESSRYCQFKEGEQRIDALITDEILRKYRPDDIRDGMIVSADITGCQEDWKVTHMDFETERSSVALEIMNEILNKTVIECLRNESRNVVDSIIDQVLLPKIDINNNKKDVVVQTSTLLCKKHGISATVQQLAPNQMQLSFHRNGIPLTDWVFQDSAIEVYINGNNESWPGTRIIEEFNRYFTPDNLKLKIKVDIGQDITNNWRISKIYFPGCLGDGIDENKLIYNVQGIVHFINDNLQFEFEIDGYCQTVWLCKDYAVDFIDHLGNHRIEDTSTLKDIIPNKVGLDVSYDGKWSIAALYFPEYNNNNNEEEKLEDEIINVVEPVVEEGLLIDFSDLELSSGDEKPNKSVHFSPSVNASILDEEISFVIPNNSDDRKDKELIQDFLNYIKVPSLAHSQMMEDFFDARNSENSDTKNIIIKETSV